MAAVVAGVAALIFTANNGKSITQNGETETNVESIYQNIETETLQVKIDNTDKKGIIDELVGKSGADTRYERKPIGSMGRYLVKLDHEIQVDSTRWVEAWIEDEDGNDLYSSEFGISSADDRFDIYNKAGGFLNSDFELINKGNQKINGYPSCCCIRFDDFDIIAETSSDGNCNTKLDPTETEYTTYFDIDGNVIENVYEYISQHGAKPEDGMYIDDFSNGKERPFIKKGPQVGALDIYYDKEPAVRIRVGNTGHYLCGEYNSGIAKGNWIEAEDGTDLYNYHIDFSGVISSRFIYVLDAKNEIYLSETFLVHGDGGMGSINIFGGDFKQTDSYRNAGNITNRERYLTVEETENGMSAEEKNAQINKR